MIKMRIDRNIPIPTKRSNKFPFSEMEVGDSFFVVPDENQSITKLHPNVSAAAVYYVSRYDKHKKFKTMKVGNGIRVWRIL